MTNDELLSLIRRSYALLVQLDFDNPLRIYNQSLLADLLDAIAKSSAIPAEELQGLYGAQAEMQKRYNSSIAMRIPP